MSATLARTTLLTTGDGIAVHDFRETIHTFDVAWAPLRETISYAVVLVRVGAFRRQANGCEHVLDATGGYAHPKGLEERYAGLSDQNSAMTGIALPPHLYFELIEPTPSHAGRVLSTSAHFDVRHLELLAAAKAGHDPFELTERVYGLLRELTPRCGQRNLTGRSATVREHQRLTDRVKEALSAGHLTCDLPYLAKLIDTSPHHLSRVFRSVTGHTLSRYRNSLRVRAVLNHLAEGASDLSELATLYGFADHAHLSRTVRKYTCHSPAALRLALRSEQVGGGGAGGLQRLAPEALEQGEPVRV